MLGLSPLNIILYDPESCAPLSVWGGIHSAPVSATVSRCCFHREVYRCYLLHTLDKNSCSFVSKSAGLLSIFGIHTTPSLSLSLNISLDRECSDKYGKNKTKTNKQTYEYKVNEQGKNRTAKCWQQIIFFLQLLLNEVYIYIKICFYSLLCIRIFNTRDCTKTKSI